MAKDKTKEVHIEYSKAMPEHVKQESGHAWYLSTGEFIGHSDMDAIDAALDVADIGPKHCEIYKVSNGITKDDGVRWGPAPLYKAQYDKLKKAGLLK